MVDFEGDRIGLHVNGAARIVPESGDHCGARGTATSRDA